MARTTRAARAATAESDAASARAPSEAPAEQDAGGKGSSSSTRKASQQQQQRSQSQRKQTHTGEDGSGEDDAEGKQAADDADEGHDERQEGSVDDRGEGSSESDRRDRQPAVAATSSSFSSSSSRFKPRNPDNYIKIMLATDNHVGFMERDPVRGQDSINTFREILQLAVENDVDMILLGGDLFHDNKPSRATLHQVIASIREKCLSDKPVSLELLSDPNDGQADGYSFPAVNYEDSNLNVGIPIFSIHGNHDDPQGVGVDGALSALDLLSVSGLVNYFGKVELPSDDAMAGKSSRKAPSAGGLSDVGIRIRPVLLQKGDTKLALYGMGNIKDERMHYELRSNRVRMYRPSEDPDEWFNILCVHQNRAAHNPKACVPETMFDDSIHLVVWGHEHEQLIHPTAVGGKQYHITQPGSSVATSLSAGEATEKQVALLHIEDRDYLLEPITLQTVRPFIMDDMALGTEARDAHVELDDRKAVQDLLKSRVYELIDRAQEEYESKNEHLPRDQWPEPMLPLVRLRVECEASYEMSNPIRFGQEFIDKVANPRDILSFTKPRANKKAAGAGAARDERFAYVDVDGDEDVEDGLPADRFEKIKVGGLVQDYLNRQTLQLLNAQGLDRAITNFVDKDDRDAIMDHVASVMKTYQKTLNSMVPSEHQLEEELGRIREEQLRARAEARGDGDEQPEESRPTAASKRGARGGGGGGGGAARGSKAKAPASASASNARRRGHDSDDSMLDGMDGDRGGFDDYDDDDGGGGSRSSRSISPVKRGGGGAAARGRGSRGGAARRGGRATASSSKRNANKTFLGSDDDEEEEEEEIEDDDDDEDDARAPARKPTASRADVLSRNTKKKAAPAPTARKTPAAPSSRAAAMGGRAAARKANERNAAAAGNDDGDGDGDESDGFEIDEEMSQPAPRSRGHRR